MEAQNSTGIDLTQASEAAGQELCTQILGSSLGEQNQQTRAALTADAAQIIRAALPHLRDAILKQAEKDAWVDHEAAGGRNTQHGYTAWWLDAYRKRCAK